MWHGFSKTQTALVAVNVRALIASHRYHGIEAYQYTAANKVRNNWPPSVRTITAPSLKKADPQYLGVDEHTNILR